MFHERKPQLWLTRLQCLALWMVAACGSKVIAPNVPRHKRPVATINIEGNTVISDSSIKAGLVNKEPSGLVFTERTEFSPGELARDAERIEGAYRQQGYFAAKVRNVDTALDEDGHIEITFTVEEGKPVTLTSVAVNWQRDNKGNYEESSRQLRSEVGEAELLEECCRKDTRKGDLLNHPRYLKAKRRLKRFFLRRGYAHVRVDGTVLVDRDRREAKIEFIIDPGPLVRFGETKIVGTDILPTEVVSNRLTWEKGEIYSPVLIQSVRGRLLRLGHFSSVDIDIDHTNRAATADVRIKVSERRLREIRLGGGGAADAVQFEVRARTEYTKTNVFFDPRTSFRARFQPAYRWLRADGEAVGLAVSADVSLERIDFLLPLIVGTSELRYELQRFESYSVQGPEIRLSLQRPFFNELLNVGVSWNGTYADFPRLADSLDTPGVRAQLGLDRDYRLGYYRQSIALDTRDQVTSARQGVYASINLEEGSTYALGNYDYVAGEAELRIFLGLGSRTTFATRGRYSRLLHGDVLPLTRRYFAGGASSHRGFSQRRLTPVMGDGLGPSDNGLVGGTRRLETSAELRIQIYPLLDDWITVVPFVDAGDVTENGRRIDVSQLHWAAGIGLRVGTPVGPFRLDFGYRLNRYGTNEPAAGDRFAFHISLGEAF